MDRNFSKYEFGHHFINPAQVRHFKEGLAQWWTKAKRDFPWRQSSSSKFSQIVSEVLLQRTRAETVAAFWPTFISEFPSWKAIARSSPEKIQTILTPIGLAKQRAPRLHALAVIMAERNGQFPECQTAVEQLPGVGQYIANAVSTFCHGKTKPLLDVNMARVVERYFGPRKLSDIRHDPYLQKLTAHLVSGSDGKHLNWAILDFAAAICTASKAHCEKCPVCARCAFRSHHKAHTQSSHRSRICSRC